MHPPGRGGIQTRPAAAVLVRNQRNRLAAGDVYHHLAHRGGADGLVGAGGIGIELKVAMDMFQYQEAATIIICIFALVIAVEQLSIHARRGFM